MNLATKLDMMQLKMRSGNMSTELESVIGTNGESSFEVRIQTSCGHSKLLETEPTRLCVLISTEGSRRESYAILTNSQTKELIAKLQSIVDGNYHKYEQA